MTRVKHAHELAEAFRGRYASLVAPPAPRRRDVDERLAAARRRLMIPARRRPAAAQLTLDELVE